LASACEVAVIRDLVTLGCGVMLHFKRPGEAIEDVAGLMLSANRARLSEIRTGVALPQPPRHSPSPRASDRICRA